MGLAAKLSQAVALLRYGPTRLDEAHARVAAAEARLMAAERRLQDQEAATARALAQAVLELQHRDNALEQVVTAWSGQARESIAATGVLRREIVWMRDQLAGVSAALDCAQAPSGAATGGAQAGGGTTALEEGFYPALEREFRGSEQDVRLRMAGYREWIDGLPPGPVGDLGCGRGEWLELLGEWGREARGVDLNAVNARNLRERGLAVDCADALAWLAAQPSASFSALTAFHLVEHLPFGVLLRLAQESHRVLQPGGRLILETPNPENLDVSTHSFWLDPTHQRPLPPALLELVARYAGLEVETTLRLNPPHGEGAAIADPTLRSMLMQGRDYAVVARKPANAA